MARSSSGTWSAPHSREPAGSASTPSGSPRSPAARPGCWPGRFPSCAAPNRTGPRGGTSHSHAAPAATHATPGGPVTRLLPHHRYVCTRHRYWIGPPDAGQQATALGPELADIVSAQWRHLRLLRRYGTAATYDAVLTGFLICGHLRTSQPRDPPGPWHQWTRRAQVLAPPGSEASHFSASRVFAAAYPEAVNLAGLITSPAWRTLAAGNAAQQQQSVAEAGRLLGRPGYQPSEIGDAIAHWTKYDSWRPPSRPHTTFPQTRAYGSDRPAATSRQSLERTERSGLWFTLHRHGGNVILHHRHIQPVLVRDWSPKMDGITATIWASQTTLPVGRHADRTTSGP